MGQVDPVLAAQTRAGMEAELEKATELRLGNPEYIRDQMQQRIMDIARSERVARRGGGALFPSKNKMEFDMVTMLPYFAELSALRPGHRAFAAETGHKFTFQHSVPYGPQYDNARQLWFQSVGIYLKDRKLAAFVHFVDTGNEKGPHKDSVAQIDKGVLFLNDAVVPCMLDQQGVLRPGTFADAAQRTDFFEDHVIGELNELIETGDSKYDRVEHHPFKTVGGFTIGVAQETFKRMRS